MQVGKKRDEKSDIYSLGVIFWELTSGTASFGSFDNKLAICCHISKGLREETIAGTPSKFSELYKKCWDSDPQGRPTPSEILTTLDKISKETSVEFIINTNQRPVPILTNNSSQMFRETSSSKKSLSRSIINFTRSSQKMLDARVQGLIFYEANNYEGSLSLLSKSSKINPDDTDALKYRGLTLN
ncbi:15606_t:CDS:1 [Cetraspora pellucida]|uniref:15606_t:CDS:1 n=1 Tax=Cetraspora pellucida TaxID=1433469 RepID=A0A9N9CS50_9GLOM|nr:15606_t:CDS:1 [Cetraspora pellucida]